MADNLLKNMVRNRLKAYLLVATAIVVGWLLLYRRNETPAAEGMLVFAVGTRLPEGTFAGIRHRVQIGTGKGIWSHPLGNPLQRAEQLEACSQQPWCANTDIPNYVVFGCGQSGYLYDARRKQRFQLQIPDKEKLIALSTKESFAIFAAEGKMLVRKYQITKNNLHWLDKRFIPDTPSPDAIYFCPNGNAILVESGGWTYLLPALGQGAVKVFQARAIGWMPDGVRCVIYNRTQHTLLLYDMWRDRISVLNVSRSLGSHETPIALSPTGRFILTIRTRFDYRRLLPEVKSLCVRGIADPQQEHCIDAGWTLNGVCWLSSE
ncbi:MAG: hypothetical protein KatS3mg020_1009 [Fimbriimonadales bacterium]|nr:MAG: hypothetical protein KatS3mg020_1009 [Fimbriimonadales bacterium]